MLTTERRDWRDWQSRFPASFTTSVDLGGLETAAEYMEFDYPGWFGTTGRTWRGCLRDLAASRHLTTTLFDVPQEKPKMRR